ncbi:hypothetical protein [Nonomuraea sp. JJY05]|uniref:hypothetical protein n=1 Tax=Nonomuraea sp. JJY05 TaxID=3350255 RepID=UPI00373E3EBA
MSEQYHTLTLAHPLRTVDAEELCLEARVHNAGERLTLLKRDAWRLAGNGLVLGADTNNRAAWADAMPPVKSSPSKPALKAESGKAE